jgi:cyclic pyranopterin phosphate synthase
MRGGPRLTHVAPGGAARMVDVSEKPVTAREAVDRGRIRVGPLAMRLFRRQALPKGNALEVARIAGVLAAKRTADVVPLCHSLPLDHVDIDIQPRRDGFEVEARVRVTARTGAEMEALHAVSVACLTLYDMLKAVDRTMALTEIHLVRKTGGTSRRPARRS